MPPKTNVSEKKYKLLSGYCRKNYSKTKNINLAGSIHPQIKNHMKSWHTIQ